MKKTSIKNFGGLTYVTVTNIPVKQTEFGDVIDMAPRELEKLVAAALIQYKVPVRGAERKRGADCVHGVSRAAALGRVSCWLRRCEQWRFRTSDGADEPGYEFRDDLAHGPAQ